MMQQPCKEEFSDWPNALLSIGTFGINKNLQNSEKSSLASKSENTNPEESEEVDKELRQSLNKDDLSIEKLFDCLSENVKNTDDLMENKENRLQRTMSVVDRGEKDITFDKKSNDIKKKSLSFLIKKAFLCSGGFEPNPLLRDPIPDYKLEKSRMEKILRVMLHKKIYPQRPNPNPKVNSTKYLNMQENDRDDETSHNSSKWVKTDSEYIVLEI
ncbi:hypothetical protein RD792_017846 [Penstemon davidsonii]|uniref:Uncharacterized protein n=1 Tax=Penstemon davidsonii TaxID=160366 RepID=A0ABR0DVM0_9LAMI|nr:hypothetical protein RD792_017846 [Penstemon davidsonii]